MGAYPICCNGFFKERAEVTEWKPLNGKYQWVRLFKGVLELDLKNNSIRSYGSESFQHLLFPYVQESKDIRGNPSIEDYYYRFKNGKDCKKMPCPYFSNARNGCNGCCEFVNSYRISFAGPDIARLFKSNVNAIMQTLKCNTKEVTTQTIFATVTSATYPDEILERPKCGLLYSHHAMGVNPVCCTGIFIETVEVYEWKFKNPTDKKKSWVELYDGRIELNALSNSIRSLDSDVYDHALHSNVKVDDSNKINNATGTAYYYISNNRSFGLLFGDDIRKNIFKNNFNAIIQNLQSRKEENSTQTNQVCTFETSTQTKEPKRWIFDRK